MSPGISVKLERFAASPHNEKLYAYLDAVFPGAGQLAMYMLQERTATEECVELDMAVWNPNARAVTLHAGPNLKNLKAILGRSHQIRSHPDVFAAFVYDFLVGVTAYVREPYSWQKLRSYLESIPSYEPIVMQSLGSRDIKARKASLRRPVQNREQILDVSFPLMARPEGDPRYLSSVYLMCLFQRCYALLPKADDLIRSLES